MTYYLSARDVPKPASLKIKGLRKRRADFGGEKTENAFSKVSYYVILSNGVIRDQAGADRIGNYDL
jgi:hypothetical protein